LEKNSKNTLRSIFTRQKSLENAFRNIYSREKKGRLGIEKKHGGVKRKIPRFGVQKSINLSKNLCYYRFPRGVCIYVPSTNKSYDQTNHKTFPQVYQMNAYLKYTFMTIPKNLLFASYLTSHS
jgi:hypothetical protein